MTPFFLRFAGGQVTGEGKDIIGRFTFTGEYNEKTGQIRLIKQYLGRHRLLYIGDPDGEGSIHGTWHIGESDTGPFAIRPSIPKPRGDEPIQEMT
jgi:hypothetical protein